MANRFLLNNAQKVFGAAIEADLRSAGFEMPETIYTCASTPHSTLFRFFRKKIPGFVNHMEKPFLDTRRKNKKRDRLSVDDTPVCVPGGP